MSTTTIIPSYHTVSGHTHDCSCSFCRAARTARMNLEASADFVLEERDDTYRVFIIGPMSGEKDWNRPLFELAREVFMSWYPGDCVVQIPHDGDRKLGLLPGTHEDTWTVEPKTRAEYLRRTFRALTRANAIVTLPYWWDSNGAASEGLAAAAMGLDLYRFDNEPDDGEDMIQRWDTPYMLARAALGAYSDHLQDLAFGLSDGPDLEFRDGTPPNSQPQAKGDPRFHSLLREMGDLHDRKQADYGRETDPFANVRASADFGIAPWVGAMVRANDKMQRLKGYAQGNELANESARDSFMDLAVYALIGLILHDEQEAAVQFWTELSGE